MSYYEGAQYISLAASAGFSTLNYRIVQISTAGQAQFPASAGGMVAGVVVNGASSGGTAQIQIAGVAKVCHDGTLVPGGAATATTAGLATSSTTVDGYYLGTVLTAPSTVSGTFISLLIQPMRAS